MSSFSLRLRSFVGGCVGAVLGVVSGSLAPGEVDRALDRRVYVRSIRAAASNQGRLLLERADVDPFSGYFGIRCAVEVDSDGRGWIVVGPSRHRLAGDSANGREWTLSSPGLGGLRVVVR